VPPRAAGLRAPGRRLAARHRHVRRLRAADGRGAAGVRDRPHTVTPSPSNSLGVKGIGEAGTIAATPAVVNAVIDALRHEGITYIDMPLTPLRVWQALEEARGRGDGPRTTEQGVELPPRGHRLRRRGAGCLRRLEGGPGGLATARRRGRRPRGRRRGPDARRHPAHHCAGDRAICRHRRRGPCARAGAGRL